MSREEERRLAEYMEERRYLPLLDGLSDPGAELPLPVRREINKTGSRKKRVVYSFPEDFQTLLKMTAWLLYRYDGVFCDNCYAFRRDYGAKDAVRRIRSTGDIPGKYWLKVDISNYFNSISVPLLLERLAFLREKDGKLYAFLEKLLTADRALVSENGRESVVREKRGAMAGMPLSPFLANVYLTELDRFFEKRGALYFRYSDDILLFADSGEELEESGRALYDMLERQELSLNPDKVSTGGPGEAFEFLGFGFRGGQVDLSEGTLTKIKGKIRRKAHALRRWQQKKGLPPDRAAKGFIRAMNRKFYDDGEDREFSWSRWFFPCLTCDTGLKAVDAYMQQYIRFCVTGRHYRGNYRISYTQMKEWGYRSLVHEYYRFREGNVIKS